MSQDEFTRLFNHISKRFDESAAELAAAREEFREGMDRIYGQLDALHGKADIDDTERLVLARQLDRHGEWIEKAGEKIGLKYDPAG